MAPVFAQAVPDAEPVVLTAESPDTPATSVTWVLIQTETEEVTSLDGGPTIELELLPGRYEVILTSGQLQGESNIEVTAGAANKFSILLAGRKDAFGFMSPEAIKAGHLLRFDYRGPNLEGDRIFVAHPDMEENRYSRDEDLSHRAELGPPVTIVAPALPGDYEIRYLSMAHGAVLFRHRLAVTDADVRWRVPAEIVAATEFSFEFSGPSLAQDRVFIATPEMDSNRYYTGSDRSHKAADGTTATLIAPVSAGNYEIRYFSGAAGSVLARHPIAISEHSVTIDGPRTVDAGTEFEVHWTGPKVEGDFLFLTEPSLEPTKYYYGERLRKVSGGSPAKFTAPTESGPFEVRYYSKKNGRMVAKRTFVVR